MGSEIRSVGVVGGGQMGTGIAQVAAQSGFAVTIVDRSAATLERSQRTMLRSMARLVSKGTLTEAVAAEALARLTFETSLDSLAYCDLIIEAVPETFEIKAAVFTELSRIAKPDAILASNTSSISITRIAAETNRPAQVIGLHFMNPVPMMKLVEVIRGIATSEETAEAVKGFATALDKTTIESSDLPGFVVNRILVPMINEACFALMEGTASVEDIDTAMKLGANHPMGPFALADLIGLDVCLAIMETLQAGFGDPKYRPCPLLRTYVSAGWLGRKSGRGFHIYQP
ncbi:MAG: 3-hydroxybutyryl-CoA dehydrogenase [Deltaproteobacteria bacterium]|nr:3-hydroxybutyryl-CoA dehydrogenase [Deltaproteobacteria bacterium]